MKRFLLLALGLLLSPPAFAQDPEPEVELVEQKFIIPINYVTVRNMTADQEAYDALVARFEAADPGMGLFDIAMLYFGWVFKPGYKGNFDVEHSPVERLMNEGDFQQAWDEGMAYLKENPLSLVTLKNLLSAGNAIGRPESEMNPLIFRFSKLLLMIFQTGDGFTESTAYKVISRSDEQIFMDRILGVQSHNGRMLTPTSIDRFDFVNATNFDRRFLYIDASLAIHFGPKWEAEEIPEEETAE